MSRCNEVINSHFRSNYTKLVKRMRNRVPDNSTALAEEVVQEAYARAMKYYRTYDASLGEFDTWFNRILNNTLNVCKNEEGDRGVTHFLEENTEDIRVSRRDRDLHNYVLKEMDVCKARERDILKLFFIHGFKSKDVAEFTNKSHTAVRQTIFRFRERMVYI